MGYIAAGVAVAASVGSAAMQAESARKAGSQQAEAGRNQNMINLAQYIKSRGGDPGPLLAKLGWSTDSLGQAGVAILPEYQDPGTEKALFDKAVTTSNLIAGDPTKNLATYNDIVNSQQPAIQAGNQTIADIYNGNLTNRRLTALDPVLQARLGLSDQQAQALEVALAQQQTAIGAQEAAKGYTGSGSYGNNRMLAATVGAREQIATGRANATLQNATDVMGVNNAAEDLKLRSLDTPINRASQLITLNQAPGLALAQNAQTSTAPLNFFKLNPGNAPQQNAIPVSSVPSMGGVLLSGAGQAAGAYGQYQQNQNNIAANNALMDKYIASQNSGWGNTSGGNGGFNDVGSGGSLGS